MVDLVDRFLATNKPFGKVHATSYLLAKACAVHLMGRRCGGLLGYRATSTKAQ